MKQLCDHIEYRNIHVFYQDFSAFQNTFKTYFKTESICSRVLKHPSQKIHMFEGASRIIGTQATPNTDLMNCGNCMRR